MFGSKQTEKKQKQFIDVICYRIFVLWLIYSIVPSSNVHKKYKHKNIYLTSYDNNQV